jgi:tRNA A-37 threonylcarbamoyl transferase component Bud32
VETTLTHVSGVPRDGRGDQRLPGEIPNYEMLSFIKAGGFGDVWLARERVTGVRRAVKVVYKSDRERATRDIDGVRRYQRCAHNHPHLLQILTVGENERCFYYVMEAADDRRAGAGEEYAAATLRAHMAATGHSDARSALQLLLKLASAVSRLHSQGLAHHDLKPENVLIVDGEPKIADVGLVANRSAGPSRSGTPAYMTPQGQADDIYALGKILYELLSGHSADAFPSLPATLLNRPPRALRYGIRIVNRACHTAPHQRFKDVDQFRAALAATLSPELPLVCAWRRTPLAFKALAVFALLGSIVAAGYLLRPIKLVSQQDLPLDPGRLSSVAPLSGFRSYARLAGLPLDAGFYALALPAPLENFVLDCQLCALRPTGNLNIGLAAEPDENSGAQARFCGQPDGRWLRLGLYVDGLPYDEKSEIIGHPQPGVDYVLRLARVNDTVVLALWPLARDSCEPLWIVQKLPSRGMPARFVTLKGSSEDALAAIDVTQWQVREYSAPLARVEDFSPPQVGHGVVPARIPGLLVAEPLWGPNLLSGEFHPYDSAAWMPIGNFAWWSGAAPDQQQKEIRCTPGSRDVRSNWPRDGYQILRFDRAEYGDFEATLRIKLATGPKRAPDDPFLSQTESGNVGLAFRLQDQAPRGAAWGGGYVAYVVLEPDPAKVACAGLYGFNGLVIPSQDRWAVRLPNRPRMETAAKLPTGAESFLAAEGFTIHLRAAKQHFTLAINDQVVLEGDDPDGFAKGRIGLYASKLIATFDALQVAPLPAD